MKTFMWVEELRWCDMVDTKVGSKALAIGKLVELLIQIRVGHSGRHLDVQGVCQGCKVKRWSEEGKGEYP